MKTARILIVDDDQIQNLLLQAMLESRGYAVQCAESGEGAIDLLQVDPPDVILLDVRMPGIGGFETCRLIREVPAWNTIPILMMTTLANHEKKLLALEAGAHDFLTKPIDEVELQARIGNLLRTKELYDCLEQRNTELQHEIAERKRAEERYRDLVEKSEGLICTHALDGTLLSVNSAGARLLGYQPAELVGHNLSEFLVPSVRPQLGGYLQQIQREPTVRGLLRVVTKEGHERILMYHNSRCEEVGHVPYVRGYAQDITDRIRAEEALTKAREQEIEIGFKIQQTLLLGRPPREVSNLQVATLTIPSQRIDGDFYDFFKHGDRHLDVVVGDVMGKGVPAALLGAATKSHVLRAISELLFLAPDTKPTPRQIIATVYAEMSRQLIDLESFVTLCYARFDLERERLDFVDCGHTRTVHLRQHTGTCQLLAGKNLPLGWLEGEVHQQVAVSFEPGDVFIFYSDGLTEARNAAGECFGEERLIATVAAHGQLPPEQLIETVRREVITFANSETFSDDLTCVVVKVTGPPAVVPQVQATLAITSDLTQLVRVRTFIQEFCQTLAAPAVCEEDIYQLELAGTEAASNIMRHAYHGRPDKRIHVVAEASAEQVRIHLSHWGETFDPSSIELPPFDGSQEGGFGLYLIAQCVDQVTYTSDGQGKNCVCLHKSRRPSVPSDTHRPDTLATPFTDEDYQ